jgi:hypothetical protein
MDVVVPSLALVDPIPFKSSPADLNRSDDALVSAAHLLDSLMQKLRYVEQENILSPAVRAGDIATPSALFLALREALPSDTAYEETSRIAHYLEALDMSADWEALPKLDVIPIIVFKTTGGPVHFKSKNRENWNHLDGIYGWSALRPKLIWSQPGKLEGGHFDAFSGKNNLAALSGGVSALVRATNIQGLDVN